MAKGLSGVPVVAGGVVGILFFVLTSLWLGKSIIPSQAEVEAKAVYPAPEPLPPVPSADEETGEQVYARVCAACHQATGAGLPPTFPPLAGSSWATGDPETPIRIVLAGLSGPIEVKGTVFQQVMPTQAALTDAQIAKVLTFVRSSFGNAASEVAEEQVAALRPKVAERGSAWTAAELTALRGSAAVPAQEATASADAAVTADGGVAEGAEEAVAEGQEGEAEAVAAADPAVLAEAKKNFDMICSACHGVQGNGAGPAGMALQPKPANFTDPAFWQSRDRAHIIKVITLGGAAVGKSPLMAPFGGQFSEAQIAGLADYVMSFAP